MKSQKRRGRKKKNRNQARFKPHQVIGEGRVIAVGLIVARPVIEREPDAHAMDGRQREVEAQ